MRNNKYRLSIERDVLRVNGEGALSKQGFPKTISSDNKFIVEQDDNYLIKIKTPYGDNALEAYDKFEEITNVALAELYKLDELIWPNSIYSSKTKEISLYTKIRFELNEDFFKEYKGINKKAPKTIEDANLAIKNYLMNNFANLSKLFGNFKVKANAKEVVISNIALNVNDRYGISQDDVLYLVACMFDGLKVGDTPLKLSEAKQYLLKTNREFNLKAEDAIVNIHNELKEKVSRIDREYDLENKDVLKLAKAYMKEGYLQRYTMQKYKRLVAESTAIIKDAIANGVDYEVLNEAKSVVKLKKGNREEFVIEGNKTDRDNYIFPIITDDKYTSKMIMKEAGLNVPEAILLDSSMNKQDIEYLVSPFYNTKIVVKPRNTNYGTGITVFSKKATRKQLLNAIDYAFQFDTNVLIEQYCKGMEYRFLVVNGKCLSVAHRRNASIVGDGKSTIMDLIKAKNKEEWHALTGCPIKIEKPVEDYLDRQGYSYQSVVPEGKRIFLRTNSNCSTGGESLDYTNIMPTKFKKIAEKAARAFDAKICGVDIIIDDLEKDVYSIIEINDNPGYSINEWPYEGKGEKIGTSILKLLNLI